MEKPKPLWIRSLLGMSQRQAMDEIADNYSPFLLNICNDKPGTWGKRKGSVMLGAALSGSDGTKPAKGLVSYKGVNGTKQLRVIREGKLYIYDEATDSWSVGVSSFCTSTEEIASVNFKDRTYHVGPTTYLKYVPTAGTTATEVGSGSDRIYASFLAVAQNTLFVGGRPSYENRVYYSKFNLPTASTEPNQPTHQLWEDTEQTSSGNATGTLANSSRYFTVNGAIKNMLGYDAINNVVVFTEDRCYTFDLSYADNALGPKTRFNIGCAGKKAATVCNDWLVWMDPKGRIQAWGGAAKPSPISWEIEDDENGETILNKISKSTLSDVAAGSIGNKFYFSVGNVTWMGETFSNVLIKGLVTADFQLVIWGIDTLPYKVTHFEKHVISGEEILIGASSNNNVYWLGTGANDSGTAIDARAYTKFYDFGVPYKTKDSDVLWVKYRPQSADNTYLTIKYALDGNFSYTALSTPDAGGSAVTNFGVIDMYHVSYATKLDDVSYVQMPQQTAFRSISIMFQNAQASEDFEISQFGFNITSQDLDIRQQS